MNVSPHLFRFLVGGALLQPIRSAQTQELPAPAEDEPASIFLSAGPCASSLRQLFMKTTS